MMRFRTEDDFHHFPAKDPGSVVRAVFDGQDFQAALRTDGEWVESYYSPSLPALLDQIMELLDLHRAQEITDTVKALQREAMQRRLNEIMATSDVRPQTVELLRSIGA